MYICSNNNKNANKMETQMPSNIKNFAQFKEWINPSDPKKPRIEVYTKKKTNRCVGFKWNSRTNKVEYKIEDDINRGSCKLENMSRFMRFFKY